MKQVIIEVLGMLIMMGCIVAISFLMAMFNVGVE